MSSAVLTRDPPRCGRAFPTIECLLVHHEGLPRGPRGERIAPGGRHLLTQAARLLYGRCDVPARDDHKRWRWEDGLNGSLSHCGAWSLTALSAQGPIGVDLQDHRNRPGALAWLGELVHEPDGAPANIRQFAECEAIIKATRLTKETFSQVRLPRWRPGWRRLDSSTWLWSSDCIGIGAIAVAAAKPATIRWWVSRSSHGERLAQPLRTRVRPKGRRT